mmetsp:Transcript_23057/g.40819  ORF Transcript_23057/g.40819 Transcript_23057/m.40819 type:complete len:87 (-) Transcript_23057:43-303(-)
MVTVNPMALFKQDVDLSKYVAYAGSLTTPGCFQTVTWVVLEDHGKVSFDQLNKLRHTPGFEDVSPWRSLQPHNGRHIFAGDKMVKR